MPARIDRFCGRSLTTALLLGAATLAAPAGAESPVPSWMGVKQVAVLCQASAEPLGDSQQVAAALCERAAGMAGRGAPVPVRIVRLGDKSLSAANTATLLIQAAVTEVAPRRLGLVIAARTDHRSAIHPDESYFGATPRVAPFTSVAKPAAWDPALAASLQELLPWMTGRMG